MGGCRALDRGLLVHVPDAFLLPQIREATGLVSQRFTAAMGKMTRRAAKFLWEEACRSLVLKDKFVLHATSADEAEQSSARFPGLRTVIVSNGVDVPGQIRRSESTGELRITYLGRLHPIKGIENLLDACKLLEGDSQSWHLKIAGAGESDYRKFLGAKLAKLQPAGRIEFLGEVAGEAQGGGLVRKL